MNKINLAEKLADFYDNIRKEGILGPFEDAEKEIIPLLNEDEVLYFRTVSSVIVNGLGEDVLPIVFQNAKAKCGTRNVVLDAFFDLLIMYFDNTRDLLEYTPENAEKLKDADPSCLNVRRILKLMANTDSSKCSEIVS